MENTTGMNIVSHDAIRAILSHDLETTIRASLGITRQYRKTPWLTPLVRISDIPTDLAPNHKPEDFGNIPVGHQTRNFVLYSPEEAESAFVRKWDCLYDENIPYRDEFMVAGGAVVGACISPTHYEEGGDADIFILSPTQEGCTTIEKRIHTALKTVDEDGEGGLRTEMNSIFALTMITNSEQKVQIIRRGYCAHENGGMAQVLAMFDLSSCKFGYGRLGCEGPDCHCERNTRNEIFCTLDGAIALFHGINIVNWEVESPSFWSRMEKYSKRGFRVVYPGLNMTPGQIIRLQEGKVRLTSDGQGQVKLELFPVKYAKTESDYEGFQLNFSKINNKCILDAAVRKDPRGIYFYRKAGHDGGWHALKIRTLLKRKLRIVQPGELGTGVHIPTEERFKFLWGPERYSEALILRAQILGAIAQFLNTKNNELDVLLKDFHPGEASQQVGRDIWDEIGRLRGEYIKLLKARAREVQDYINSVYSRIIEEKYLLEQPGQQFYGAFNKIIRNHPREFWTGAAFVGDRKVVQECWKPFPTTLQRKQKFTLLCMRKFHPSCMFGNSWMANDIFWELVKDGGFIDQAYLRDVYETGLLDYGRSYVEMVDPREEERILIARAEKIISANPRGKFEKRLNSILRRIKRAGDQIDRNNNAISALRALIDRSPEESDAEPDMYGPDITPVKSALMRSIFDAGGASVENPSPSSGGVRGADESFAASEAQELDDVEGDEGGEAQELDVEVDDGDEIEESDSEKYTDDEVDDEASLVEEI